ncbi:hypothetical protein RhiirA4_477142 [Rhizophagus irregularis]|uniref:Uncharacterized protein n=1 Tax=Rhizophagus irregularis TaxID=588596 RepID=A0A2I1HCU3_9GLOM|nr:hypothetical protein RhiirA4_477142 [Rhizophagus irregularis]
MKNRTPYAMHFKIGRLQFEYKNCGRAIGYSNTINDMMARILNGEIATVKIKKEIVSNDEQIIEVIEEPASQEGHKLSGLPNEQFETTIVPPNNEFGDFPSLIQADCAQSITKLIKC